MKTVQAKGCVGIVVNNHPVGEVECLSTMHSCVDAHLSHWTGDTPALLPQTFGLTAIDHSIVQCAKTSTEVPLWTRNEGLRRLEDLGGDLPE